MLVACHDKVRRFANLCLRLDEHVGSKGADAEAQQAATSILRYFDVAAPLHHDDEELDLFPALRTLNDATLTANMAALEREHEELGAFWRVVRPWLAAVAQGELLARPPELSAFAISYPAHARREETEIYPAAVRLPPAKLAEIGAAMQQRRGQP